MAKCLQLVGLFLVLLPSCVAASDKRNKFDICRDRVIEILEGKLSQDGINNITIWDRNLIYTGPIHGLATHLDRSKVLTITYEGCVAICGPDVELQEPNSALSIVATWIFPLAIVLSLPYESLSGEKKVRNTLFTTLNWLGSPQTALTATIFNFWQIKRANTLKNRHNYPSDSPGQWNDALYVLTCLSQYDITHISKSQTHLEILMYGLFRPTVQPLAPNREDMALIYTRELLTEMAFQLRMLRRRAVIPTLASLGTFLVAYIFSVVLSFADMAESGSVDQLGLGLLYTWLPVLVIFTIVDRNPVFGERAKTLMQRWLYNVQAVRLHEDGQRWGVAQDIQWWPPPEEASLRHVPVTKTKIGEFIGQGRSLQYSGLSHAVMDVISPANTTPKAKPEHYAELADKVHDKLRPGRLRPISWFIIASISQLVVISVVMLAFMLAFNTPTVGLGCWSGGFALYAALSSFTWTLSLFVSQKPGRLATRLGHMFNALALAWLITVTILILTGAMNTCYCQTSPFSYPHFGGYMTFEPLEKLREMFNVTKYWGTAAGFGLLIPVLAFLTAVHCWRECAPLWKMPNAGTEDSMEMAARSRRKVIDMGWLAA